MSTAATLAPTVDRPRRAALVDAPAGKQGSAGGGTMDGGNDVQTVQELLGHNDVKTTMIHTTF